MKGFDNFMARFEDPVEAARELYQQAGQLRDQRRELNGQIANLEAERADMEQQVQQLQNRIPDGGIIIEGEDAARWEQYRTLGEPSTIEEMLHQAQTERRRADILHAAQAAHLNSTVLSRLLPEDATLDVRSSRQDDGTETQAVFITLDGKESLLTEFAKENWHDFMPALQVNQAAQAQPTAARPYPPQQGNTPPQKQTNIAQERLEAAKSQKPINI